MKKAPKTKTKTKKNSKRPNPKEEDDEAMAMAMTPLDSDGNGEASLCANENPDKKTKMKKTKKKSKKAKSKPQKRDPDDGDNDARAYSCSVDDASNLAPVHRPVDAATDRRRVERATRKAAKVELRARLKSQIPTVDPDGVPYSKMQVRRMMRRVKHGLSPIPTEEEEREMRAREAQERREEEALYAASTGDDDEVNADGGANEQENEKPSDEPSGNERGRFGVDGIGAEVERKTPRPLLKRARRSKPVPSDYVCRACMNGLPDFSPHWIYDCPMKETRRGCNAVAKRLRGLRDPPSRKVFVSGLPFDCTEGAVRRFFEGGTQEGGKGGAGGDASAELVHCKLLKFEDSHRCKGQAFLTFSSDDGAKLALKLDGSAWREVEGPGIKGKKGKEGRRCSATAAVRKELKVKVTKVLNRHVTKQKAGMS